MELQECYDKLVQVGLCRTGLDFSENYCGKYRSYYSVVKARGDKLNTDVLVHLNYCLRRKLARLQEESSTEVQRLAVQDLQKRVNAEIQAVCEQAFYAA
ncbi:DUF6626 family protein [Colwellia piezophila]|uniref:DUF6626 family protein n=1 Tax=Colwellia piezophila TaxID=211668 RepID=UPI00037AB809|nr:DUF6626 family protein [Colwellia piezophila]